MNFKNDLNVVNFPVGLAIRTGDVFTLEKWDGLVDYNISTYAVALFLAPPLSELGVSLSNISNSTGVVTAGLTQDGWGWIQCEAHTKDYIGQLLVDQGARLNEWFKLTITYQNVFEE